MGRIFGKTESSCKRRIGFDLLGRQSRSSSYRPIRLGSTKKSASYLAEFPLYAESDCSGEEFLKATIDAARWNEASRMLQRKLDLICGPHVTQVGLCGMSRARSVADIANRVNARYGRDRVVL